MGLDLRAALRSLGRQPSFTVVAILTLALGIGATTAVFSVVHAVLLRPLAFGEPDRLFAVWETDRKSSSLTSWASYPDFVDFLAARSFSDMAAYQVRTASLTAVGAQPERLTRIAATPAVFSVLGIRPVAGRPFRPDDDDASRTRVAIVSDALACRLESSPEAALGADVVLDAVPHVVVGVLPRSFRFIVDADVWTLPAHDAFRAQRGVHAFRLLARLGDSATAATAQAELATIARALELQYPATNAGRGARIEPLIDHVVGDSSTMLIAVLAAVGGVLLIACANIASLTMARATARRREVAVRAALGAGAMRVVRPFLVESLLLAAAGGIVAIIVAAWSVRLLIVLARDDVPRVEEATVDGTALAVAVALSLLSALLTAAAPALQALRGGTTGPLARGADDRTVRSRFAHVLVVGQTAMAVVVVVGAALLVESVSRLERVDPGFDPSGVIKFQIELPAARYPETDWPRIVAFYERLVDEVRTLPGVTAAAAAFSHPLDEGFSTTPDIVGRAPLPPGTEPEAYFRPVTENYFEALGIPLLRGRAFDPADSRGPVGRVVVNQSMAEQFFAGTDAIGRQFRIPWPARTWPGVPDTYEIVGIVANERFGGLADEPWPAMYFPHRIAPMAAMSVLARSAVHPETLVLPIRRRLATLDPALPMFAVAEMTALIHESIGARRLAMVLLGVFALQAFALAILGVYGLTAYSVSRRLKEIGIRLALGAEHRSVVAMIVGHALGRVVLGVLLGLVGATLATPFISSLLYGVEPTDLSTFAMVAAGLTCSGLVAAYLPARAAARVDPATTLRAP